MPANKRLGAEAPLSKVLASSEKRNPADTHPRQTWHLPLKAGKNLPDTAHLFHQADAFHRRGLLHHQVAAVAFVQQLLHDLLAFGNTLPVGNGFVGTKSNHIFQVHMPE